MLHQGVIPGYTLQPIIQNDPNRKTKFQIENMSSIQPMSTRIDEPRPATEKPYLSSLNVNRSVTLWKVMSFDHMVKLGGDV